MLEIIGAYDPAILTAFIAAGLLLNITPGADFVFISASAISGGARTGMAAALGVNIGVTIHVLAASAGVSAVLLAYPLAYDAIRFAGAAYLLFLAYQMWRNPADPETGKAAQSVRQAIRRGFITNFLNPKTALFIFAFIPQFTDPSIGPVWMQILFLGAVFQVFGLLFSLSLGAAAGAFAEKLHKRVRVLHRVTSVLFAGLAARLVLN